jgi:hypothetical protein
MSSLIARIEGWLFAPAPAERLAVLRVLVAGFATAYLLVRLAVFLDLADGRPSVFEPVGVLAWLTRPLPGAVVTATVLVALVASAALTLGVAARWTGPLAFVALLAATTYRSSWGQLLHFENLLVLHMGVVAFSASADAYAVTRRGPRRGPDARYGWPVRLAALFTVATYVLAGVAKLRYGGLDWMLGDTLRNHVAYAVARLDVLGGSPPWLGQELVRYAWLFPPMAVASVVIELSAPLALRGGRLRTAWVAAAWLMHAGIAALMHIVFPYPLSLVAFAPLFRLERLPGALRLGPWRPRAAVGA